MKKSFIIFTLIIYSLGFGQSKSDLIGQWAFDSIHCSAKKDSSFVALTETLYKNMSIHFLNALDFKSNILNRTENGKWSFIPNKNKVILLAKNGALVDIKMINFSKNSLTIKIGNIELVLKRK